MDIKSASGSSGGDGVVGRGGPTAWMTAAGSCLSAAGATEAAGIFSYVSTSSSASTVTGGRSSSEILTVMLAVPAAILAASWSTLRRAFSGRSRVSCSIIWTSAWNFITLSQEKKFKKRSLSRISLWKISSFKFCWHDLRNRRPFLTLFNFNFSIVQLQFQLFNFNCSTSTVQLFNFNCSIVQFFKENFSIFSNVTMMFEETFGRGENWRKGHVQSSRIFIPEKGLLSCAFGTAWMKISKWCFFWCLMENIALKCQDLGLLSWFRRNPTET